MYVTDICSTAVWLSQDPMAEKYPSLSPYSYCAEDPVNPFTMVLH